MGLNDAVQMIFAEEYKQHQAQLRESMKMLPKCSKQCWALSRESNFIIGFDPSENQGQAHGLLQHAPKADVLAETCMAKSKSPERSTSQTLLAPPHLQMADFVVFNNGVHVASCGPNLGMKCFWDLGDACPGLLQL